LRIFVKPPVKPVVGYFEILPLDPLRHPCHAKSMPKRTGVKPKRLKRPRDVSQWAHQIVQESTQEKSEPATVTKSEVSRVMAALGRKGGLKGGKSRMALLTDDERSDLASKAAHALWAKRRASN